VHGEAKAVLEWIDSGGLRTPIYIDMDRSKLRMTRGIRTLYYYDGTTVDPRGMDLEEPWSSTSRTSGGLLHRTSKSFGSWC